MFFLKRHLVQQLAAVWAWVRCSSPPTNRAQRPRHPRAYFWGTWSMGHEVVRKRPIFWVEFLLRSQALLLILNRAKALLTNLQAFFFFLRNRWFHNIWGLQLTLLDDNLFSSILSTQLFSVLTEYWKQPSILLLCAIIRKGTGCSKENLCLERKEVLLWQ